LLLGSHEAKIRIFTNRGSKSVAKLQEEGLLSDPQCKPIQTYLALRVDEGDIDNDGQMELISSSYYGNQNRYVVYQRKGAGWEDTGYLNIQATP